MLSLTRQNLYREKYRRRRPGWQTSGEKLEALTRGALSASARVLDIGCGRGGVLELFWPETRRAVGVDPDWASLVEHRAGLPRAGASGEALPFPAATFDVVLAVWVLEHLAQPERVLAEAARVLKPGGRFIFITPNGRHPVLWAGRISQAFPLHRWLVAALYGRAEDDTFRVFYRANTFERLRQLAAATGFTPAVLQAVADPTYLAFNDFFFEVSVWLESRLPAAWGVHWVGEWIRRD